MLLEPLILSSNTFEAGGSGQSTAIALDKDFCVVTDGTGGVRLPIEQRGAGVTVKNATANAINVYPPAGGEINSLGTNTPYSIPADGTRTFSAVNKYVDTTDWVTESSGVFSDGGTHSLLLNEDGAIVVDGSAGTAGQVLTSNGDGAAASWEDSGGELSIEAGDGMDFATITESGSIVLGTPSSITLSSTNSVAAATHSHAFEPGGSTSEYIRGDGSLATLPDSVTSVAAGNGLNFTTITSTGSVTLGTPSNITLSSTNSVTTNSHTHNFAPGGSTAQYIRGDGSLASFPSIPAGTVTSVAAGNGLNFTTITGSGSVTLGTPGNITLSSTNSVSSTSHTHNFAPGGSTSQYLRGDGSLATFPTVTSGTYTPTCTAVATVSSCTGQVSQYIRVGNVVHVSGSASVTASAATLTSAQIRVTLPVAASISNAREVAGTVGSTATNLNTYRAGSVSGDATNDAALLEWVAGTTSATLVYFTFTYVI